MFKYNPCCLNNDLKSWYSQRYITWQNVTALILEAEDIATLHAIMQGDNTYTLPGYAEYQGGHIIPTGGEIQPHRDSNFPSGWANMSLADESAYNLLKTTRGFRGPWWWPLLPWLIFSVI